MNSQFFSVNRDTIAASLDGALIVLTANTKLQNIGDVAHVFRQESNFWYLTGIEYPDWQLVVDGKDGKSWLIAPEVDSVHQLFDGSLSYPRAKEISGVDDVLGQEEGQALLQNLSKEYETVHTLGVPSFAKYVDFALNPAPSILRKKLKKLFSKVEDCQKELARMRAIKQPEEIEATKNAIGITMAALENAKTRLASCRYEYEVDAELSYYFRRQNAVHAFEPIVAGGANACTLHYVSNNSELKQNKLLLIDVGARLDYYSGDITRTFAVGKPTKRQKEVHGAVKGALEQISSLIKPGTSIKEYLKLSDGAMKEALISLGLIKNGNDAVAFRRYFPHAVSHGLGLDVHESLGGYDEFLPGMVLTVEPGVYIPEEEIGVRLEDNILITKSGSKNLTTDVSTDL